MTGAAAVSEIAGIDWNRRMADLGRGAPTAHPPLFAPMLFAVAAEIEAIAPAEFVSDPTKIVKGSSELSRVLGLRAAFTGVPCGMVAEALGARLDRSTWPPKAAAPSSDVVTDVDSFAHVWPRSPLLAASLEATRRLACAGNGPLPFIALDGPGRVARQLFPEEGLSERTSEFAGRALAALVRDLAEAGAGGVVLVDEPTEQPAYRISAMRTIGNVARFHRRPLFSITLGAATEEPPTAIPCVENASGRPAARAFGTVLPAAPAAWAAVAFEAPGRLVTTAEEVSHANSIETLTSAVRSVLERLPGD